MHSVFSAHKWSKPVSVAALLFLQAPAWAAGGGTKPPSSIENPVVLLLLIVAALLLIAIGVLSFTVLGAAGYFLDKWKQSEARENDKSGTPAAPTVMVILALLLPGWLFAQDAPAAVPAVGGQAALSSTALYLLTGVIFLEVMVILFLLFNLRRLIAMEKKKQAEEAITEARTADAAVKPKLNWWERFNNLRPAEHEVQLDLGHDYDGIRELDNSLPRWWVYGFYLSILFAGIYLWRHHISHSDPLSIEEYQVAMKRADEQKAEFLKKSANMVDENTVKLSANPADIAAGKAIFETTCFACHGKEAQGGVGPNLTDDYWLHGGSIHDVFKSIKYGWPEKGMKSWKDDFSPVQIASLANYVKSLHGTNPPNPKEKQGELYKDSETAGTGSKEGTASK